jgi:hypothetical protein
MSLHYEWMLSLRLRPDVPDAFVDELRFHLGLSDTTPPKPTLDYDYPVLSADADQDELPGGQIARLVRQQHGNWPEAWGVLVRRFVLDDEMYQLVQDVPQWLARWSLTEGWIGFAREELNLDPWLNFYAARGHGYAASPGERPQALSEQAPPFAAAQTTEPWPLRD